MIKNIIFDFDGVIVDSEVLASKAFSKYFSKFDKSIKEEQFYKYAGKKTVEVIDLLSACLLYTSPSPRDSRVSRMPSSA